MRAAGILGLSELFGDLAFFTDASSPETVLSITVVRVFVISKHVSSLSQEGTHGDVQRDAVLDVDRDHASFMTPMVPSALGRRACTLQLAGKRPAGWECPSWLASGLQTCFPEAERP
jgi:hypothetical protein